MSAINDHMLNIVSLYMKQIERRGVRAGVYFFFGGAGLNKKWQISPSCTT
jgi:hypothetical protein